MNEPRINAVCEGTAHEQGIAQGSALRRQVGGARDVLARLEAFRLRQPWWLPYPLYRRLTERTCRRLFEGALAEHDRAMAARLAGIAEGAGIGLGSAYLLNAVEALMSSIQDIIAVPSGGCSAVAVRGAWSATGEAMIAHNFDYLPIIQPFYVLRDSRPAGGIRSLDFTVAPLCGTVDGVKERGLAIACDYAFVTDPADPAPTISMAIADALATCATVAEAAERIAARPRWGGGLLMLADAGGDIASLELSNTRSHLRRPEPGVDVVVHTNRFSSPELREVEIPPDACFTDAAPTPLRGRRVHESAEQRDARFACLLAEPRPLTPDGLAALMADHGPDGQPGNGTPCRHSDYWHTSACIQLLPRSGRLRAAYAPACRAAYADFALGAASAFPV